MTKKEKMEFIDNEIGIYATLCNVLEYSKSRGRNMVISNEGRILFNKAGTTDAVGGYKEGYWNIEFDHLSLQDKKTIDFVYSICK